MGVQVFSIPLRRDDVTSMTHAGRKKSRNVKMRQYLSYGPYYEVRGSHWLSGLNSWIVQRAIMTSSSSYYTGNWFWSWARCKTSWFIVSPTWVRHMPRTCFSVGEKLIYVKGSLSVYCLQEGIVVASCKNVKNQISKRQRKRKRFIPRIWGMKADTCEGKQEGLLSRRKIVVMTSWKKIITVNNYRNK